MLTERREHAAHIASVYRWLGEGFDLPRLDTLFLVLPISLERNAVAVCWQDSPGRRADGKQEVTVYDYLGNSLPMLERMF